MQRLYVGTSGWSYADWDGVVYPRHRPRGFSGVSFLAEYFDAVELNTTFYRPPTARMSECWLRQSEANRDFLFTAKLWQRFTHQRWEPWTDRDRTMVIEGLRPLVEAGKLGALLIQFPWSFVASTENRDWLQRVAGAFARFPLVVEVRHASWLEEEALDFLRAHSLGFCNIDQPTSTQSVAPTNLLCGPVGYFRFHGRNRKAWFDPDAGRNERYNYLYGEDELEPWARGIEQMLNDANRIFVMNNNHYRGQAAVNALQLKARLGEGKVNAPSTLVNAYPILKRIARPQPWQQLLDL